MPEDDLRAYCCDCGAEIEESQFHQFGGPLRFACADCVTKHYPSPPYSASEAALQLKERSYSAREILKYKVHRRTVEKQTANVRKNWTLAGIPIPQKIKSSGTGRL